MQRDRSGVDRVVERGCSGFKFVERRLVVICSKLRRGIDSIFLKVRELLREGLQAFFGFYKPYLIV